MSGLGNILRQLLRQSLTDESWLTADEACEALPGRANESLPWLIERVKPVGEFAGEHVYRWGDIQDAVLHDRSEPTTTWMTTEDAAARLGIHRETLDQMVAQAPRDLPGAPLRVGRGRERRHLRWDAAHLADWADAYRAWHAHRGRPGPAPKARTTTFAQPAPSRARSVLAMATDPKAR